MVHKVVEVVQVADQAHQQLLDRHYKVVEVDKDLDLSLTGLAVAAAVAVGTVAVAVAVVMTMVQGLVPLLVVVVDLDT